MCAVYSSGSTAISHMLSMYVQVYVSMHDPVLDSGTTEVVGQVIPTESCIYLHRYLIQWQDIHTIFYKKSRLVHAYPGMGILCFGNGGGGYSIFISLQRTVLETDPSLYQQFIDLLQDFSREGWRPSEVTIITCTYMYSSFTLLCGLTVSISTLFQLYRKVSQLFRRWPHLVSLFIEFLDPQDCIEANSVRLLCCSLSLRSDALSLFLPVANGKV